MSRSSQPDAYGGNVMLKIAILSLALFAGWVVIHADFRPNAPDAYPDGGTMALWSQTEQ